MTNAARPRPEGWRRFVPGPRQLLLGVLGGLLLLAALFVVGYVTTNIPSPSRVTTAQTTFVYAADGHTVLGRIGTVNRTDVPLSEVPTPVQRAVLAAEDRNYYSEPGISYRGIARALVVDLSGGNEQGGSTITQQYAKIAFLTQQRTLGRKIREVFLAMKLDRSQSKAAVLQDYLNAIYFGRGAYGIEAAARTYFGRDVQALDTAQGAVLAGLIRSPSGYDPALHPSDARARWQYVIRGMVTKGWLSPTSAAKLHYPRVLPPRSETGTGPDGWIVAAARTELAAHGFDADTLAAGGYKVITTIDPAAQRAALSAESMLHQQVSGPVSALVSVQPGDGAIRAYYAGAAYDDPKVAGSFYNLVQGVPRQPGSSFKPYVMLAALEQGVTLNTVFDGTSPKFIPGIGELSNSGGEQCPACTLTTALARSINTVFVPLAQQVGPAQVALVAHAAGIPASDRLAEPDGNVGAGIALGIYPVTPLDQAVGFATIAARGVRAEPYLVASVQDPSGTVVYRATKRLSRVFDPKVTADATYAMQQVLDNPQGTAAGHMLAAGRPAAGKTGTSTNPSNQNTNAWFVGFTPQLSTAVWLGNLNDAPLTGGTGEIFGGQLPAQAWQTFMDTVLAGAPVLQFPPPTTTPTPTTSPTASPTPRPTHTRRPSPSPTPKPTRSPTPSPTPVHTPKPTGSPSPNRSPQPPRSPGT